MFGWIRKLLASNRSTGPQSKYDHAQTTDQNVRHWANADALGPIAALDPNVRKTLRDRVRYELANDPHLAGLSRRMALDLIGTGPRLQLQVPPEAPAEDARSVERSFALWSKKSRFALRLRSAAEARRGDGEIFATLETDLAIAHPVKLRFSPFESDLVCETFGPVPPGNWADGIDYDERGNPRRYAIQHSHPGDQGLGKLMRSVSRGFTVVPAELVLHWFRPIRPGQIRGVTEFASVLGTVAQLRPFGNATLSAAEFAASISGTLYTDGDLEDGPASVKPRELFKLDQNMAMTMPAGWKLEQLKAEQPTASYKDFSAAKLNEVGRPVGAPMNVISGNSSGYNYSSGRLDHVPYNRDQWIERDDLESTIVDPVIASFLKELDALGLVPRSLGPVGELTWACQWDGFNSIDPFKDAQASQLRITSGLSTLAEECAAEGKNWRDVLEQQAVEMKLRKELGLPDPSAPAPAFGPAPPPADPDDPDHAIDDLPPDDPDAPADDDTELDRPPAPRRATPRRGRSRVPA